MAEQRSKQSKQTNNPLVKWVFTLNNPTDAERAAVSEWLTANAKTAAWQLEQGEKETPHLQGAIWLSKKYRLSQLKKEFSDRAHFEPMRGTWAQARDYAMKEQTRKDGPWTVGYVQAAEGQGSRNDLNEVKDKIDAGSTMLEVFENHFRTTLTHYRGLQVYSSLRRATEREWHTYTTVYWGKPGTGKSRRAQWEANAYAGSGSAFWLPKPAGQTGWWCGYDQNEVVVIDDFYGWLKYDHLLRLCDRYPTRVETKGGSVGFTAKRIIITSNKHPELWFPNVTDHSALMRRLSGDLGEIVEMNDDSCWVPPSNEMAIEEDDEESGIRIVATQASYIDEEDDDISDVDIRRAAADDFDRNSSSRVQRVLSDAKEASLPRVQQLLKFVDAAYDSDLTMSDDEESEATESNSVEVMQPPNAPRKRKRTVVYDSDGASQ